MSTPQNRQPAGVPTGGQFASSAHAESGAVLVAPANEHPTVLAAIAQAKTTGKPVRIEPEVLPGCYFASGETGSVCGDTSLGAEPSNRATWATGNDHEPFITVTETFYVVGRRDGDDHDLDFDEWNDHQRAIKREQDKIGGDPDSLPAVRYAVEHQCEWIAHTDADDPGASEVRSDYQNEAGSDLSYLSLATAEAVARNRAQHIDWDRDYAPQNWK